jgi:hypothetical protein
LVQLQGVPVGALLLRPGKEIYTSAVLELAQGKGDLDLGGGACGGGGGGSRRAGAGGGWLGLAGAGWGWLGLAGAGWACIYYRLCSGPQGAGAKGTAGEMQRQMRNPTEAHPTCQAGCDEDEEAQHGLHG